MTPSEATIKQAATLPRSAWLRAWRGLPGASDRDLALRQRHRYNLDEFACYCWPEATYYPFNRFHRSVIGREKVPWRERLAQGRTIRRAYAAPRGIAKSTLTKFDVIHDLVHGLEGFIVVLSATNPDAYSWTRTVKKWLTDETSPLWGLYGPITVTGSESAFFVRVRDLPEVPVVSRSFGGGSVRGLNELAVRPTRVIIDDGEDRKRVKNPRLRADGQKFLNEDVLKLFDRRGGGIVDWLGTVLHPDALLARIKSGQPPNAGWHFEQWRAWESLSSNTALWEQCRAIWTDLDASPDRAAREANARAFYEANRPDMDAGAEILDPHGLDLFKIYTTIWDEGLAAALKELNNDPTDPSERIFDVDGFRRCTVAREHLISSAGKRVRLSDCAIGVWLDPIAAKATGSDYAALAVVARERATGRRFVLSCALRRVAPSGQRALMWDAFERFGPRGARYGYEDNGFQALFGEGFDRERADRERAGRPYNLRPAGHTSTTNKVERIARLEPDCANGFIEFAADLDPRVIEQFRDVPNGTHDDAPDAIERADWLITQGGAATVRGYRSLRG